MGMRKGFVYTLEAIIASTLILGMVLFIFPEVTEDEISDAPSIREKIEKIDERGNLSSNITGIEDQLDGDTSSSLSVRQVSTASMVEERLNQEKEFYLENSTYKDLMLWVDSANNLEVTFQNETIIETDGDGYMERGLSGSGWLNFTGSIDATIKVMEHREEGDVPDAESIRTVNHVTELGNKIREVQVRIWD